MKTKIKILVLIWLSLILIFPGIVTAYDFDEDGIDDGEQNMCGDNFCQPFENVDSCPQDCSNPQPLPSTPPESSINNENSEENFPTQQEKTTSLSNTLVKIAIAIPIVLIVGIIAYLIFHKKRKVVENSAKQEPEEVKTEDSSPESLYQ